MRSPYRVAASVLAGVLAVGLLPAWARAAPVIPTTPDQVYTQKSDCIGKGAAQTPATSGVSWAQRQLDYTEAWKFNNGTGVKVAVIDTGVNPGPEFNDPSTGTTRLTGLADYVDNSKGQHGLTDCDGHGTIVAGIIGASLDPTTGFAGVAPGVTLLSIRQNSDNYQTTGQTPTSAGTQASLANAINYAVANGAQVINMSLADCTAATTLPLQPLVDAVANAVRNNVVVVAAAGNVGTGTCATQNTANAAPVTRVIPADLPGVLAVGAVQEDGTPASFSLSGSWVGVAAPGTALTVTDPYPGANDQVSQLTTSGTATTIQGTSFAAPYVAGIAALIIKQFPGISAAQVIQRIEQTAAHPAAPGGRNDYVGYGVVDPVAALTDVLSVQPAASPTPIAIPAATVVVVSGRARTFGLIGAAIAFAVLVVFLGGLQTVRLRRRRARLTARQLARTAVSEPRAVARR